MASLQRLAKRFAETAVPRTPIPDINQQVDGVSNSDEDEQAQSVLMKLHNMNLSSETDTTLSQKNAEFRLDTSDSDEEILTGQATFKVNMSVNAKLLFEALKIKDSESRAEEIRKLFKFESNLVNFTFAKPE